MGQKTRQAVGETFLVQVDFLWTNRFFIHAPDDSLGRDDAMHVQTPFWRRLNQDLGTSTSRVVKLATPAIS
jgi:hypothetical protein